MLVSACQLTPTRLRFLVLSASVKPSFLQLHGGTSGRIPPLPPVVAEPPANPEPPANSDPPEEPLAEPAAQPVTANQVISSFWCISFVPSFSYPFVRVSCFFSNNWDIWFSCKFVVPCLAYSAFHVSLGHIFVFLFASFCIALFVHVFHFIRSFLFWFVCVPFGSGSQYFVWNEIFLFVYTVRDRSAPGAGSFSKTRYCDCGAGPLGSRAGFVSERIVFCIRPGTIRSQVLFKNKHWCMWSETVWLWDPVLCLKRIFCWFVSGSRFFLLFGVKYYCMRSWPARLRDPVLVIYAVRNRFALGAG